MYCIKYIDADLALSVKFTVSGKSSKVFAKLSDFLIGKRRPLGHKRWIWKKNQGARSELSKQKKGFLLAVSPARKLLLRWIVMTIMWQWWSLLEALFSLLSVIFRCETQDLTCYFDYMRIVRLHTVFTCVKWVMSRSIVSWMEIARGFSLLYSPLKVFSVKREETNCVQKTGSCYWKRPPISDTMQVCAWFYWFHEHFLLLHLLPSEKTLSWNVKKTS